MIAAFELLGFDALNVANEGKLVAVVAPKAAALSLATMGRHPLGRDASIIGTVVADGQRFVQMTTAFGAGASLTGSRGNSFPG